MPTQTYLCFKRQASKNEYISLNCSFCKCWRINAKPEPVINNSFIHTDITMHVVQRKDLYKHLILTISSIKRVNYFPDTKEGIIQRRQLLIFHDSLTLTSTMETFTLQTLKHSLQNFQNILVLCTVIYLAQISKQASVTQN